MSVLPEPDILLDSTPTPEIPLPKGWTELTLRAVLHVISLAMIVILNAALWPNDREYDGPRLRVENARLRAEVNLLQQELANKDARFARLEQRSVSRNSSNRVFYAHSEVNRDAVRSIAVRFMLVKPPRNIA